MKIYRDRSKRIPGLSQYVYIEIMLKQFSLKKFKKGYLLIGHEIILSKKYCLIISREKEHKSRISYASIVGSIIYAMICTSPDVAYSLGVVSRY